MTFSLEILDIQDDSIWDGLVADSPHAGSFLQSTVLKDLAQHENPPAHLQRLVVLENKTGDLVAGWAFLIRRRLGIRYSTQFPLFYNGPFYSKPYLEAGRGAKRIDILNQLARGAQQIVDVVDCECVPGFPDPRGLLYAGFHINLRSCHIWESGEIPLLKRFNRTKRNEANRAIKTHQFHWLPVNEDSLAIFRRLHDASLEKFSWNPPVAWREALTRHTKSCGELGFCRFFSASPSEQPSSPCAIVSVLLNSASKTAFLWRVGFDSSQTGLIAALYAEAGNAIREEYGSDWDINFGGSPRFSLSQFKDYLGAEANFHYAVTWQRPGYPWWIWNGTYAIKERILGLRRKIKSLLS
jgi:hypothetical protein